MRTRPTASPLARWAAILALVPAVASAQSGGSHDHDTPNVAMGDLISLVTSDARLRGPLEQAIAMWSGCPQYGVGFPRFETVAEIAPSDLRPGERHRRKVTVALGDRAHPGRGSRCGTFQGGSIILHRRTVDDFGRAHYCGALGETLAHEIGHALGIEHAEPGPADRQGEQVMTSTILANIKQPRQVRTWECAAVDRHWMTSLELAGASALGLGSPTAALGRSLVETAEAWHEAVAMGLVDPTHPVGSALADKKRPTPGGLP